MTMPKPTEVEKLSQDVCMREIPLSEMGVPEADDYILNYCGTEFYAKQAENRAKKQKK
ncbi:DUF3330 domain-containing protein [bacterium endosymbiont of Escarpia laminata]|nr:MAG: DUF3330 domain-containing protein [bacterium endosymbiont of Escarpia laminata]